MTAPLAPVVLDTGQVHTRLHELTLIDVRTPGEYASGHLPGAVNIPLDHVRSALPGIREAAARGEVLFVCASGARSENACRMATDQGVAAATLAGGTSAWAAAGLELERPVACATRSAWSMERQVRFTAGSLVLIGLVLGLFVHPAFLIVSAGIAGGLVFSALTDTCGMAVVLGKLPHNRARGADLSAAVEALRGR